jgi:hypothetical protein
VARLDCLARYGLVFALTVAAWGGCGGKSSSGSTGTAGTGGGAAGDAGTGGSIATGGGGIAGGGAGTGGSVGSAGDAGAGGNVGSTGGAAGGGAGTGGSSGGAGGTGGAPCAQHGATCDFPDITCYYEMHPAGAQNYYYGCTCGRGDGGPARITCCFVGNAFSPNGILTPANMPDWWLTPSGSPWRCPSGS